jgi:hypothetical protein
VAAVVRVTSTWTIRMNVRMRTAVPESVSNALTFGRVASALSCRRPRVKPAVSRGERARRRPDDVRAQFRGE